MIENCFEMSSPYLESEFRLDRAGSLPKVEKERGKDKFHRTDPWAMMAQRDSGDPAEATRRRGAQDRFFFFLGWLV